MSTIELPKAKEEFRVYDFSEEANNLYRLNHKFQTVDLVKSKIEEHCTKFDKGKLTVWEIIEKLDSFVDESDPDLDLPQIYHGLQAAEMAKTVFPDTEWMPLVALIHDCGKIIGLPEYGGEEQWATVGDTFPVGCQFSDQIVLRKYFEENDDIRKPEYSSKLGIYKENCGLDNVLFSFGHDEYMYQVLKHNGCLIPEEGLKVIRYHSFYAGHKDKEYTYLMNEEDQKIMELCEKFSQCDLYSKDNDNKMDIAKLKEHYTDLIKKYFPNEYLYL